MDILQEGEPLPEEARRMLARALDALEKPHAPPPDDVIHLIAPDLVATLGWTVDQAREVVATAGIVYEQDPEIVAFQVAEEVQQWLHDSFLDTSWPPCPSHRNHPLWLAEEPPFTWHCQRDAIPVAPLGHLSMVVPPPSPEQATAACARLLHEQSTTRAMIEQLAPALRPWHDQDNWRESPFGDPHGFDPPSTATFRHDHPTTQEGVIDRIRGVSHVAALPANGKAAALAEVRDVLAPHPKIRGHQELRVPYRVDCFSFRRA